MDLWVLFNNNIVTQDFVSVGTPKADRMKRARSVTSDTGGIEDDNRFNIDTSAEAVTYDAINCRSTTSSQSVGPTNRTPTRKTPSQVKAEAAARKAKVNEEIKMRVYLKDFICFNKIEPFKELRAFHANQTVICS